ncbi:MAG: helix-turn-helix transcriptional regulator [Clostridia bacterium]|nr:helix-turn-helix transcriptional regulator [Clostridia bacterium]
MEKKTIGNFIAALRKANGMTQKDLADRLNVSDKTVSRWECNEGAPDLSLIPVIAEIFDITCDELLRGEKRATTEAPPETNSAGLTPKAEKQRQWLLSCRLSVFRSRSYISMGITLCGLIAAMISNLGFLRAYIGFFAGVFFFIAGGVSQMIWLNNALTAGSDDPATQELTADIGHFRHQIIRLSEGSFGLIAVLFGATLPLLILPRDSHVGLSAQSWLMYGAIFALCALLLTAVICFFLNYALLKRNLYTLESKKAEIYLHNRKWKKICAAIFLATLSVTLLLHSALTTVWGPWSIMKGTEFYDYDSFIAYMETDIPYTGSYGSNGMDVVAIAPADGLYYDEAGNVIPEEEALRRTLEDRDGNVLCEYIERNQSVCSIRWTDESIFPITVCTYDDLQVARATVAVRNGIFITVYCMEAALILSIYLLKRKTK